MQMITIEEVYHDYVIPLDCFNEYIIKLEQKHRLSYTILHHIASMFTGEMNVCNILIVHITFYF